MEFSANAHKGELNIGQRASFKIVTQVTSLDETVLENPMSQIDITFFVGSAYNPLISTRLPYYLCLVKFPTAFLKTIMLYFLIRNVHLGYTPIRHGVKFHRIEENIWSFTYEDRDGVFLNDDGLLGFCGEMVYFCCAVGELSSRFVSVSSIHTQNDSIGIGGPVRYEYLG